MIAYKLGFAYGFLLRGFLRLQEFFSRRALFVDAIHLMSMLMFTSNERGNLNMQRLFALALVLCLSLGFAAPANASIAGDNVAGLTPCNESAAFQKRAAAATTESAKARFEFYGNTSLLCGPEGLPHLVVDGDLTHAGEFLIPGTLFLLIAGWIGWAGRSYIIATRSDKSPEEKEIIIDVPLAIRCSLGAVAWPLLAVKEFTSGRLLAKKSEVTVSPR